MAAGPPTDDYVAGVAALRARQAEVPIPGPARGLVLFMGDGMGITTVTAARILAGQRTGGSGEEHQLHFERFPYSALAKTYNTDQQVPDSAGTMSAIMTGAKTRAGVLAVDREVTPGDCASTRGHLLETLPETLSRAGWATGIVSTTRITHATPAATYAHGPDRDWESDAELPAKARRQGCFDLARQLLEPHQGRGPDVVLGGGRSRFLPLGEGGIRRDGQNLIQGWQASRGGIYVSDRRALLALRPQPGMRVLGLFAPDHLAYATERASTAPEEPSLPEMTRRALDFLDQGNQRFFLMVEGGRIDHGHHAGNAYRALTETLEFDKAVALVRARTSRKEVLILVTADHSHVLTMAGYPTRGNPILGAVVPTTAQGSADSRPALDAAGRPYTTLGYANGPGARSSEDGEADPQGADYRQRATTPLGSETHGGEDVPVYADGPGAFLVRGVMEQHVLYHLLRAAAGLDAGQR